MSSAIIIRIYPSEKKGHLILVSLGWLMTRSAERKKWNMTDNKHYWVMTFKHTSFLRWNFWNILRSIANVPIETKYSKRDYRQSSSYSKNQQKDVENLRSLFNALETISEYNFYHSLIAIDISRSSLKQLCHLNIFWNYFHYRN